MLPESITLICLTQPLSGQSTLTDFLWQLCSPETARHSRAGMHVWLPWLQARSEQAPPTSKNPLATPFSAAEQAAGSGADTPPVPPSTKSGKDKHKGARLANDVHQQVVAGCKVVLEEAASVLLESGEPTKLHQPIALLTLMIYNNRLGHACTAKSAYASKAQADSMSVLHN